MPDTLRVQTLQVPGGAVGYLRIWAFDSDPDEFIAELLRVIPLLPQDGLIIDVRGNPGGYIVAAERGAAAVHAQADRAGALLGAGDAVHARHGGAAALAGDLAPWRASLDAAVRNGELYSQPIPISDPADCNAIGQQYGGPVVLVGDTNTYSAGDLFSAGFVDNAIGPFLCVGQATGAGGANVWDVRRAAPGAGGNGDRVAAAPRRHRPDALVSPRHPRRPERGADDRGRRRRRDAVRDDAQRPARRQRRPAAALRRAAAPAAVSALSVALDQPGRKASFTARGLDRIDAFVDGHPAGSFQVGDGSASTSRSAPRAGASRRRGSRADSLLQRRRDRAPAVAAGVCRVEGEVTPRRGKRARAARRRCAHWRVQAGRADPGVRPAGPSRSPLRR
jgi:hypothetical protein